MKQPDAPARRRDGRAPGELQRGAYPTWRRKHEAVLRFIVDNPAAGNADVAAATGYSVWHISRIVRAPEFQVRYRSAADRALYEAMRDRFRRR